MTMACGSNLNSDTEVKEGDNNRKESIYEYIIYTDKW